MAEIDDYLQPRAAITENVDLQHIQEVGGFCPLCGKQLLVKKGGKVINSIRLHIFILIVPTLIKKLNLQD